MPLVSVVMTVYNGEKYLAQAIESVLAQTFTDFELLLVDDGSNDASLDILRSYEIRDKRVRIFALDRNVGQAAAQNTGIAAANGDFIAFMDADDMSLPLRLEKQVDFLQRNPKIGLVGTFMRWVDQDMQPLQSYSLPLDHPTIALHLFIGASLHGPTAMIRRSFLRAVEGFGASVRRCQDMEFYLRLLRNTRIKFANLPETLYVYRVHQQQKSSYQRGSLQVEKNAECVAHRDRALECLWNEKPDAALSDRFFRLRVGHKLGWADRKAAKRDIIRLIEAMLATGWVERGDKPPLYAAMNQRLEQVSPRLWQQFCHWRRHRFARKPPL